jgi:hypothetical protein
MEEGAEPTESNHQPSIFPLCLSASVRKNGKTLSFRVQALGLFDIGEYLKEYIN